MNLTKVLQNLSLPRACLAAFLFGALNVLSFAPFFIWPLQILSLTLLMTTVTLHPEWNKKQLAKLGFCFAFGLMFFGVSWLLVSMVRYGGMPAALAVIGLALLASYMSVFSALVQVATRYLTQRWQASQAMSLLLIFPVLWASSELLRRYLFTGFPWLSFGYAHNLNPLSGFASVLGVSGVGGLVAVISGAFALMLVDAIWRTRATAMIVSIFVVGFALKQIAWTTPHGQAISVRLLQTNIDQGEKFSEEFLLRNLSLLSAMVTEKPADLIVTPETSIAIPVSSLPPSYLSEMQIFSSGMNSSIVIGSFHELGYNRYSNGVLGLQPSTAQNYRYGKHHLVPFGEFVPWGFRWVVDLMHIPLGDQESLGLNQVPMQVKDQLVMPNICYEDLFGDEIAAQLRGQADSKEGAAHILLNVSNLAWFGDSIALPQHLQISQMRSLELGRPMLRSTNTGATAIINEHGEVQSQIPGYTRATLAGTVQGVSGLTPYVRFGDVTIGLLIALALFVAYVMRKRGS